MTNEEIWRSANHGCLCTAFALLGKYPVRASWLFLPVLQGKGGGTGPCEGTCQAWASSGAFPQLRDVAGYRHLP